MKSMKSVQEEGIWNELDLKDQADLISLIIKEINVNIPKVQNRVKLESPFERKFQRVC